MRHRFTYPVMLRLPNSIILQDNQAFHKLALLRNWIHDMANTPKTIELEEFVRQQERMQLTLSALVLGLRNVSASLVSLGVREGYLDEATWQRFCAEAIQEIKDGEILGLSIEDEAMSLNHAVQLLEGMLNM